MKENKRREEIIVLGVKFRTLYGLYLDFRADAQPGEKKMTLRKLGEYLREGMPHGFYQGQYVFSEEKKKEIALWVGNRMSTAITKEVEPRNKFYGKGLSRHIGGFNA